MRNDLQWKVRLFIHEGVFASRLILKANNIVFNYKKLK